MSASLLGFAEWAEREQSEVQAAWRRTELERTFFICVPLRACGAEASHWMN